MALISTAIGGNSDNGTNKKMIFQPSADAAKLIPLMLPN
jgi:hypothetical protein